MRIEEVSLFNYRQYVEAKSIDFSRDFKKDHDCYVLIAENGVGKSNFLNAITWCLYGTESHLSGNSAGRPIVNVAVLDQASNANPVVVRVVVVISAEDKKYTITRTETYKNTGRTGSEKVIKIGGSFEVYVSVPGKSSGDYAKKDDEAEAIVNRIVPLNINKFFFFDNEQLETYFSQAETAVDIKQSIYDISQITLVDNVISDLKDLSAEYTKSLGRKSPDIETLRQAQVQAENHEKYWAGVVNGLNADNKTAQKTIEEDQAYLGEAKNVQTLLDLVSTYQSQHDSLLETQKALSARKKSLITKYGILLRLYPALLKTRDFINI